MCQSTTHGHHHHHRHRSDTSAHNSGTTPARPAAPRGAGTIGYRGAGDRRERPDGRTAGPGASRSTGKLPRPAPPRPKLFDLKQVAPGIYGAIARPTAMLNCNTAVIVNRDHVLVVDTHSKPSAAKALLRQIRNEVTELPVKYVVDSHLHGDHAMGNEAYPEAFGSNVEIISSVKTREWLEKLGVTRMQETLDFLPKQIADFRMMLEKTQDEAKRAAIRVHIEGLEAYMREMKPARVTLPTVSFEIDS